MHNGFLHKGKPSLFHCVFFSLESFFLLLFPCIQVPFAFLILIQCMLALKILLTRRLTKIIFFLKVVQIKHWGKMSICVLLTFFFDVFFNLYLIEKVVTNFHFPTHIKRIVDKFRRMASLDVLNVDIRAINCFFPFKIHTTPRLLKLFYFEKCLSFWFLICLCN